MRPSARDRSMCAFAPVHESISDRWGLVIVHSGPFVGETCCPHAVVCHVRAPCSRSILKNNVSDTELDRQVQAVSELGGEAVHTYTASFLRGFSARLPDHVAEKLRTETEGGQHPSMYAKSTNTVTI